TSANARGGRSGLVESVSSGASASQCGRRGDGPTTAYLGVLLLLRLELELLNIGVQPLPERLIHGISGLHIGGRVEVLDHLDAEGRGRVDLRVLRHAGGNLRQVVLHVVDNAVAPNL